MNKYTFNWEGVNIVYEVIVKYYGDILKFESEEDLNVELLGGNYAIISSNSKDKIDKVSSYPEIEAIEKPFTLKPQRSQSYLSTEMIQFKKNYGLTGAGTIIGIIDSGIDYNLPIFKDKNNNSKILYYWDQSQNGKSPKGFREGVLYTNNDINRAIKGDAIVPVSATSSHGTHIAGICSEIANEAKLIVVRLGSKAENTIATSIQLLRSIKFILDKALEMKMPVAINISYGTNEGTHKGLSLFEEYVDEMCSYWKNSIVVAAGNYADKGRHKVINIKNKNEKVEVEFVVSSNEILIDINIWPDPVDDFMVYLVSPSNIKTQSISISSGQIKNQIEDTKIKGYFYITSTYSLIRNVDIEMSNISGIQPGIWKIVFVPITIISGKIDIYLSLLVNDEEKTEFLVPDKKLTIAAPGTSNKVITVGSYNSKKQLVSVFSGNGDIEQDVCKPDVLAPGEYIASVLPGGNLGALSGTSVAASHVTGVCSLIMEWGIVQGNDVYLYSQKLKLLLIKYATRSLKIDYPNNSMGYGLLNLENMNLNNLLQINKNQSLRKKKKHKK